jgi:hypothetical protein
MPTVFGRIVRFVGSLIIVALAFGAGHWFTLWLVSQFPGHDFLRPWELFVVDAGFGVVFNVFAWVAIHIYALAWAQEQFDFSVITSRDWFGKVKGTYVKHKGEIYLIPRGHEMVIREDEASNGNSSSTQHRVQQGSNPSHQAETH